MHKYSNADRIRILVADDYRAARSALAIFLGVHEEMELVGEASTGDEAVTLAGELKPDVILMDLEMPGMNGLLATCAIKRLYPHVKIIVFTGTSTDNNLQILETGANQVMRKSVPGEELVAAIHRVASRPQPRMLTGQD